MHDTTYRHVFSELHAGYAIILTPPSRSFLLSDLYIHAAQVLTMAATVVVQVPSVIHLEAVPGITHDMLLKQRKTIMPSDPDSGFRVLPEAAVADKAAAEKVARVLQAHYGSVAM